MGRARTLKEARRAFREKVGREPKKAATHLVGLELPTKYFIRYRIGSWLVSDRIRAAIIARRVLGPFDAFRFSLAARILGRDLIRAIGQAKPVTVKDEWRQVKRRI